MEVWIDWWMVVKPGLRDCLALSNNKCKNFCMWDCFALQCKLLPHGMFLVVLHWTLTTVSLHSLTSYIKEALHIKSLECTLRSWINPTQIFTPEDKFTNHPACFNEDNIWSTFLYFFLGDVISNLGPLFYKAKNAKKFYRTGPGVTVVIELLSKSLKVIMIIHSCTLGPANFCTLKRELNKTEK
jgi:hypothetical protein